MSRRHGAVPFVWAFLGAVAIGALGAVLFVVVLASGARAVEADACVSLPEARSVLAGDTVNSTLHRLAPDHGQVRFHAPRWRDVSGCRKSTVFRYKFAATHPHTIVAWRFLSCLKGSECRVVDGYPSRGAS